MGNLLSPPSTNVQMVLDKSDPSRKLEMSGVWHRWFLDLVKIINQSGGLDGAVPVTRLINTTAPLTGGGALSGDLTLAVAGIDAVIVTAKLTALGANGSMTFVKGVLTAQTPAT